jgi:hypothetical protein
VKVVVTAFVTLVSFTTMGCVGPEWETGEEGGGAEAELFDEPPTLVFSGDYEEWATQPLVAGRVVHIDYDLSRIGPCPTAEGEAPSWGVSARYRVDEGEEVSLPLTTVLAGEVVPIPASFIVPQGRELAIFFVAEDGDGCAIHDAYYSVDYRFPID